MTDTLRVADRVPFTAKNAHPFSFIRFFNRSPMLRRIGIFALMGYEIVEGRLDGDAIEEVRRIDFTPR